MLYLKAFFLFGACSIHLQTNLFHSTQSKHHTNAVQMQKFHSFCKQEKENGLTISLNQAKERTLTKTWVPLSGWWSETRLKRINLNGLERKKVRLDDFEVRWSCFLSVVKEDGDRGGTWASGGKPITAPILTLSARRRACVIKCIGKLINYEIKYIPW